MSRSAFLHNEAVKRANAVRTRRSTVENPQWAMSRPESFYLDRDNLRSIKDTLANIPAVTTNQNEGRNMYQMLMNKIRGGGGAELIDTRGIPEGARRIGRTLFQNPSKSAGFTSDLRNMMGDIIPFVPSRKNPAAIRVKEWNPFGNFGQAGKDFSAKEFPKTNFFMNLSKKISENLPGMRYISPFLPKKKKKIIDRTLVPWGGITDLIPEMEIKEYEDSINEVSNTGIVDQFLSEMSETSDIGGRSLVDTMDDIGKYSTSLVPPLEDIKTTDLEPESPFYGGRGELEDFDYESDRRHREFAKLLAEYDLLQGQPK